MVCINLFPFVKKRQNLGIKSTFTLFKFESIDLVLNQDGYNSHNIFPFHAKKKTIQTKHVKLVRYKLWNNVEIM